jgi:large subunit ribosomal protein L33
MARNEMRPIAKPRSTAGTGYTYATRKNRRNDPDRIVLRNPVRLRNRDAIDGRPRGHLRTTHRQVTASNGVEVDEGLRDLLEALWSRGMSTDFSCQGDDDGIAHICFAYVADAWRFMEAPGDFLITEGEKRAWVDFPAHLIGELTQYWANI